MSNFKELEVNFPIPKVLQDDIDALRKGIEENVSYIDCLQDEIRSSSRSLDDDEKENMIIDYYCRRRWS